jgi:hypothetical protein
MTMAIVNDRGAVCVVGDRLPEQAVGHAARVIVKRRFAQARIDTQTTCPFLHFELFSLSSPRLFIQGNGHFFD